MGHDLSTAPPLDIVTDDPAERLEEIRSRIAAGERLQGPLATAFFTAVHAVDPTATEDTIVPLLGNGGAHLYRSLLAWASLTPGERVLDVGCGSGGAARAAAEIVGPNGMVVGLDPCRQALQVARERAPQDIPMAFIEGRAERMNAIEDKSFDCVVASLSLEEFQDLGAAISEIRRVLRPGGRFVASVTAFDRLRPVDSAFMGAVIAVITRHAPAALVGRASLASIPLEPDDARAFAANTMLRPEERDVQFAAPMADVDAAWNFFGRTHIGRLLDEDGKRDLLTALARRLPHTLYIPLRFLRSRRPG